MTSLRLALSTLLSAVLVATAASAAGAQGDRVPHPGERPAADGPIRLPDGSAARLPGSHELLVGPLAAEIAEVELQIETVTAELQLVEPELGPAQAALLAAETQWRTAQDERAAAQEVLDELVGESYRGAAALPEALYLPELRGLVAHAPVPVDAPLGVQAAARNLVEAKDAERAAFAQLQAARVAQQDLTEQRDELRTELAGLQDELAVLLERNAELLIEAERARAAAEQRRSIDDVIDLAPVNGFRAHPDAEAAVRFALSQRGKQYQWGAEGPDRYDCSGLVLTSYRHAGHQLPRVAADQFQGTSDKLVTRSAFVAQQGLLVGDLVFFSSGPSPRSIHHVGIYVGNGQMVHAPNRREVVKVSPVWWSRFFAATRVVDALPVTESTPEPSPSPSPTPPPSPSPPPSPTPSPTPPSPTQTTVPDLIGLDQEGAEAAIERAGLLPEEGELVFLDECEQGTVGAQRPPPDEPALVGTTVEYQICGGPASVPDLVGLTQADARARLEEQGFVPVVLDSDQEPADDEQVGTVASQEPAAHEPRPDDHKITIYIYR